jgi:hypothetical protein
LLNTIHGFNTGAYRKAAKVDYPAAYAPDSRTDAEAHRFKYVSFFLSPSSSNPLFHTFATPN